MSFSRFLSWTSPHPPHWKQAKPNPNGPHQGNLQGVLWQTCPCWEDWSASESQHGRLDSQDSLLACRCSLLQHVACWICIWRLLYHGGPSVITLLLWCNDLPALFHGCKLVHMLLASIFLCQSCDKPRPPNHRLALSVLNSTSIDNRSSCQQQIQFATMESVCRLITGGRLWFGQDGSSTTSGTTQM